MNLLLVNPEALDVYQCIKNVDRASIDRRLLHSVSLQIPLNTDTAMSYTQYTIYYK